MEERPGKLSINMYQHCISYYQLTLSKAGSISIWELLITKITVCLKSFECSFQAESTDLANGA